MAKAAKMRFCFYCGEELGCYADYDPLDTCGKPLCNREAGNALADEQERAHDGLDDQMGWR